MINFFCPINNLGNGIHAYYLLRAYATAGFGEVCLLPPYGSVAYEDEHVLKWLRNQERFSPKDPGLMIFDIPFFFRFCGSPRIGFAVFESDGFNPVQRAALRSCDFLFTPSQWGRRVLEVNGFKNVEVVPEGVDTEIFRASPGQPFHKRTFIHVGKFEERKGTLSILKCFTAALENEEAVLWMHPHTPFIGNVNHILESTLIDYGYRTLNWTDFFKGRLEVKITKPGMSHQELAKLCGMVDCGIYPTKGEGWGLPILECLASGTPVITGNWTAMADYLTPEYPRELTLERFQMQPAMDGQWFNGDRGNWFVPDEVELVEKIRWAYANARLLRASVGWVLFVNELRARWTWERAAQRLKEALTNVGAG